HCSPAPPRLLSYGDYDAVGESSQIICFFPSWGLRAARVRSHRENPGLTRLFAVTGHTPAAGIHTTPGPHSLRRQRLLPVTTHCHSARQSCAVSRVAPRISSPARTRRSLTPCDWRHTLGHHRAAGSGVGSPHGWSVRRIARQRTNSRRANATIAFFFESPFSCRRGHFWRAQRLYRRLHQAHSTNAAQRSFGPRRGIRPRRSVVPLWY